MISPSTLPVLALAALLLTAAAPAAAPEPTTMDRFMKYCVGLRGDDAAVETAARRDGYLPVAAPAGAPAVARDRHLYLKTSTDGTKRAVGSGLVQVAPNPTLPVATAVSCSVTGPGPDPTLQAAMRKQVGVAPINQVQGLAIYAFRKRTRGAQSMGAATDAQYQQAIAAGELQTVVVRQEAGVEGVTQLIFLKPAAK